MVDLIASVAVLALSGWLWRLGGGLRPAPLATWIAPGPLLVLAPRVPALLAAVAAAAAWFIGHHRFWSYLTRDVSVPARIVGAQFAAASLGVAAIVSLARLHLVAGHLILGALALPVAWAAMEFLVSVRSPHGAAWSVGYTQADLPGVIQVASLAGVWGVAALIAVPAGVVAAAVAPVGRGGERVAVLAGGAAVVAAILAHAAVRLRRPGPAERVHVGVAALAQPELPVPIDSPAGAELLAGYVDQVRGLADRGARAIVLPEAVFSVHSGQLMAGLEPLARAAADRDVVVVVGVARLDESDPANVAAVFDGPTGAAAQYRKQHLVPGLEAHYRPGRELLILGDRPARRGNGESAGPNRGYAVLICKDLDFPGLVRAYRRRGARLLLAPAWDFDRDGWLHARMALLRGVESGVALARVARRGRATVSDGYGRVLAEAERSEGTAVDAAVPLTARGTVYSRLGDGFAWLCVAATVALAVIR